MYIIKDTQVENRYAATLLVAKRARDIVNKTPPLTETVEKKPVSQAIKEWSEGFIKEKQA